MVVCMIGDSYDVVVGCAMTESVCPYEIKITDMPYRVLWWLPSRPTPHKFPSEILSRHWSPAVTSFSYNQQTMNGEPSSSNAASSSTASDSSNLINVGLQDEMLGFAVTPKTDCDHLSHIQLVKDLDDEVVREAHCTHCGKPETWLCLTCGGVYCSRYDLLHTVCTRNTTIVV